MKLYKRAALGAIVFGVIGPVVIAGCIATPAAFAIAVEDSKGLGVVVLGWLVAVVKVSMVAFYGGGLPAVVVGVLVGAMATRLRQRYLYPCAVLGAPVVVILVCAVSDSSLGDGVFVVVGGFSIPATAVLLPLLLAIIRKYDQRNRQIEQSPEDINE